MVGCPNDSKQWWPTLKPVCMNRLILITFESQREAEKEESMKLSQNPWSQAVDKAAKPKTTSFFPLWKIKGNQLVAKTAAMCLAHLEVESAKRDKEVESEDLDNINGVIEEFMVHLMGAVKDAKVEENCCYHCSSTEHFFHDCPLVRALRDNAQLNCKEGTASRKGL